MIRIHDNDLVLRGINPIVLRTPKTLTFKDGPIIMDYLVGCLQDDEDIITTRPNIQSDRLMF